MRVNLEGFVLYNAAMNTLMLLGAGRLSGLPVKLYRLIPAALLGAAYAVFSNISAGLFLQNLPMKLLCALLMAAAAFLPGSPRKVFRAAACFFLSAFLLGGTGFSLMYMLGARGFGWDIASLLAAVGAVACVLLASGWRRASLARLLCKVRLEYRGETCEFTAMIDTGNHLREPVSGLPVIVVERPALAKIDTREGWPVAFSSMAGSGTIEAIIPQHIVVDGREDIRAAVAAYDGTLSRDGRYAALLPYAFAQASGSKRRRIA